jgi:phenylacetyl-CoA:acceptor oxidoreductase
VPSMNSLTGMSMELTDSTGSGADIVRVSIARASERSTA